MLELQKVVKRAPQDQGPVGLGHALEPGGHVLEEGDFAHLGQLVSWPNGSLCPKVTPKWRG